MRSQLSLTVFVGLLFCSLASIEIPELINLSDDTSNDFTVMFLHGSDSPVQADQRRSVRGIAAGKNAEHEYSFVRRPFYGAAHRSRDVLHLCCVQRT
jgi:hypothetical protein